MNSGDERQRNIHLPHKPNHKLNPNFPHIWEDINPDYDKLQPDATVCKILSLSAVVIPTILNTHTHTHKETSHVYSIQVFSELI